MSILFRQLFDTQSSTYTYLVADQEAGEALLVDPVFEHARRDAALIGELGLRLVATLETHVHADHVTAAWLLRRQLGSRIAIGAASGAEGADRYLAHGEQLRFGRRHLEARATPGHTGGCTSYVLDDASMAFTGDTLLIRGCGRTDFQEGDARTLFRSVRERIFSLPDACLVYPAHDYRGLCASSVGEERRHNPRLGETVGEDDFVGYMKNLGLAHPKQMERAVPANLRCGEPEHAETFADEPGWAPLTYTFAGIWELQPDWLEEHAGEVQIVDVREADECAGPLGCIANARQIPLGSLLARAGELDRARPVVTVCRAGARSAQATVLLRKEGFARVANLAGGILRWRAQRFPVVGGRD
jgi:sulfur dioxygenase